jgi:hypothetical protein
VRYAHNSELETKSNNSCRGSKEFLTACGILFNP